MGVREWKRVISKDLFFTDPNKPAVIIDVPYWCCGKSEMLDILFFCKISADDYLRGTPFANREQLVSNLDSVLQLSHQLYIYIYI